MNIVAIFAVLTIGWAAISGNFSLPNLLLGAAIAEPESLGLDFAFTATFIALLLGMWRGKGDLMPWLVAALVAVLTIRLVGGHWHILAGGLAGSLFGAGLETRRPARNRVSP